MSTLVVTPTLGVKTLKDFIELARARPGKIFFSSGGHGSSTHMNGERFRLAAGIKPVHVAFKGSSDAALEVVAGRVHYVITGLHYRAAVHPGREAGPAGRARAGALTAPAGRADASRRCCRATSGMDRTSCSRRPGRRVPS